MPFPEPIRGKTPELIPSEPNIDGPVPAEFLPSDRQEHFQRYLIACTISSFLCVLLTAVVPEPSEVTWLMGFSRGRLALAGLISGGGVIFLGLAVWTRQPIKKQNPLFRNLRRKFAAGNTGGGLLALAGTSLLMGLYFLIYSLNAPDFWQQPAKLRLAPFLFWVVLLAILALGLLYNLGARLRLPVFLASTRGQISFFGLISLAVLVISGYLYISNPALENSFIDEDSLVENLSAALFLWSGMIAGLLYRQKPRHIRTLLVIPIVAIWAFFEEISFGERIFNLEMPYLGGEKFDGLHDLFFLIYESLRIRGAIPWVLIGIPLLFFGLWRVFPGFQRWIQHLIKLAQIQPALRFFGIAMGLIAVSFIIDLEFLDYRTGYFLEELVEFLSAIALGFSALTTGWLANPPVGGSKNIEP